MRRNCPLQNVKQTSGLSAFISWKFLGGRDFSKKKLDGDGVQHNPLCCCSLPVSFVAKAGYCVVPLVRFDFLKEDPPEQILDAAWQTNI